jgi:putative transposase
MPQRGTNRLRKGRISIPNATYFVTTNTQYRKRFLDRPDVFTRAKDFLNHCLKDDIATTHGFILMPDHVHWLFQLGTKTALSQCVRMLKFKIRDAIGESSFRWQTNFFEHRLREEENKESYARYIFLNPYRAGLIQSQQPWPYWIGNPTFQFEFEAILDEMKHPPIEWIADTRNPYQDWLERSDRKTGQE